VKRDIALILATMLLSAAGEASSLSGRVEVLDKGNVKRAVAKDVLVYLEGVKATIPSGLLARPATVASRDKSFEPHVQAVPVGKAVSFPNMDDIMHNVFSLSKGNRFDLGLYKNGAKKDYVFETPGLVRIYCNIHPQMSAYVQVMENPYYAWVARDGSFLIEDVPPGSYTLRVWHEEGEATKPVVVTENGASGIVVELDVGGFVKRPHLNKFGKPYKREKY
jgi:plastocyanin